jgi:hypothetical protein
MEGDSVNVAGLAGGASLLALVPSPLQPVAVRLLLAVGVAVVVDEYVPVPALFTPATRNWYEVPFVRPVTVAFKAVDVPSANVVHVDPLFDENCTA